MKYPKCKPLIRRKGLIGTFLGYEHLQKVRVGAFYDMRNLSADKYPLLSVRPDRQIYFRGLKTGNTVTPLGIRPDSPITAAETVNDTVALCSETQVYYYGNVVADAALDAAAMNRRIIPFGRNFFIVPDGKYVLTGPAGATGVRHAAFSQALLGAEMIYANESGTAVDIGPMSETPPENPSPDDTWTDISGSVMILKRYTAGEWQPVCEIYARIDHNMADHYAAEGDTVYLSGLGGGERKGVVFKTQQGRLLLNSVGLSFTPRTSYMLELRKKMPPLDFAVEHGNRIWGCRFGENAAGAFVNEIYASALGDPTVWDKFDGVSTDSYTVSLGCPGAFTGAAVTGGDLLFFKENYVIRVSGFTPQDYTVSVTPARGVEKGLHNTCVNLNEKIFYLSHDGVTVYDGALPYVISPEFSTRNFTDTAAFSYNGKYYLAAAENDARRIYVYDTATGLWHVEDDDYNVRFFLLIDCAVFMLCKIAEEENSYRFVTLSAAQTGIPRHIIGPEDADLECRFLPAAPKTWYAETGGLLTDNGTNILRQMIFRLELEKDASFKAELRCDNAEEYILLCRLRGEHREAFSVPVATPRCRRFTLRLSGTGGCTVHSIAMISEKTGEVPGLVT